MSIEYKVELIKAFDLEVKLEKRSTEGFELVSAHREFNDFVCILKKSVNHVDYRALLKKYMQNVADCEGVSFIPVDESLCESLNKDDIDELKKILGEIDEH